MRRIQTDAVVLVTDPKSKPRPMTIAGTGMDLYLSTEPKPSAAAATPQPKSKSDSITGVDRISLRADVDMNLTVDPSSGFLGARNPDKVDGAQPKKPAGPTPPAPGSAE